MVKTIGSSHQKDSFTLPMISIVFAGAKIAIPTPKSCTLRVIYWESNLGEKLKTFKDFPEKKTPKNRN
jgi:hypothetical protein